MIITDIPFVIELGVNIVNTQLHIPDTCEIRNYSGSFTYKSGHFFSYNENIAYKEWMEEEQRWFVFVWGKTARYGDYRTPTTSKHINTLIRYLENHDYFKHNFAIIDRNGVIITGKKNKGKKITEDFECPICLDTFKKGKKLMCNHIFCSKCINKWLKDNSLCPLCKQSVYEN